MKTRLARLVISAPRGRSGKTTLTMGLCAAWRARGLVVQPFKKGPDYIDPSWLSLAAGRPCRTLDLFLQEQQGLTGAFARGARGADLAVVEGAMGLYDGLDAEGSASTAAVARCLSAPVVLVVDATRISRSVAALVAGFRDFEPEVEIGGVILNNVAHGRHEAKLRAAIARYCGLPVFGALPRDAAVTIPDRHLGLVPRVEGADPEAIIATAARLVEAHVDLDALLAMASDSAGKSASPQRGRSANAPVGESAGVRLGVARDAAFTFYYPANLEALQAAGAELVTINTLNDPHLPLVDGLYLGGGFPEVFLERLEANVSLRAEIREAIEAGMPVYAECGGLMYLARSIRWNDREASMVGALPCDVEMMARPEAHGYTTLSATAANNWFPAGAIVRGHAFHHSRLINLADDQAWAFNVHRAASLNGRDPDRQDGLIYRNVLASYTHIHTVSAPDWAPIFVSRAREYHLSMGEVPRPDSGPGHETSGHRRIRST